MIFYNFTLKLTVKYIALITMIGGLFSKDFNSTQLNLSIYLSTIVLKNNDTMS